MNVLILGGGGREHTFAWKIKQSPRCQELHVIPGNAGTATIATNHDLDILDFEAVQTCVQDHDIDLVIVGPEQPLVAGIVDYFEEHMPSLLVLGPKQQGAMLEGSKAYAKEFMKQYGIPTADYLEVTKTNLAEGLAHIDQTTGPYVLKADGLAAGKGVLIISDQAAAKEELKSMLGGKFGSASKTVVIEKFLSGLEFSVFVMTDGQYYIQLPEAKDYKRIGEAISSGSAMSAEVRSTDQALAALIALGFQRQKVSNALDKLQISPEMSTEEIIKLALQHLR